MHIYTVSCFNQVKHVYFLNILSFTWKTVRILFQWLKIYSVSFVILVILLCNSTVFIFVVKTGSVVHASVEWDFFCLCLQNAGITDMFHKAQQNLFILNCYLKHWSAYAISTALIKSFSKTRVRSEEWNQNPGRLFNPILQCSAGGAEYPWALTVTLSLWSAA